MLYLFLFVFGSINASFAQCFGKDWAHHRIHWTRRSRCDSCQTLLSWYDLVPIFSLLFNRFSCRHCRASISSIYFIFEFVGACSLLMTYTLMPSQNLLLTLLLHLTFLLIIVIDFQAFWIPDILQFLLLILLYRQADLYQLLWAAFIGFILCVWNIIYPHMLGMGDVKLMTILSLGVSILDYSTFLFIASGSGILYYLYKGRVQKVLIPFGPFLIFSFYLTNLLAMYVIQ